MKCILPAPLVRLVDDDNDFRESQKAFLTALGWQVEDWESPAAFLLDVDLQRPGDIRMPGMDGLELAEIIARDHPGIKVIILTGYPDFAYAQRAIQYHVVDFVLKPMTVENLTNAIE